MDADEIASLLSRVGSQGDLDALGRLFDRTAPGLLRLALRLTGDPSQAEDVLQDTFVAVLKGAHTYDPARPASAWLAAVLTNVARRRRTRPARPLPDDLGATEEVAPADSEAWRRTRAAIEGLPPRERTVLLLRHEHGLPAARIAEILGLRESGVRALLSRATDRLRKRLLPLAAAFPATARDSLGAMLARVRDRVVSPFGAPASTASAASATAFLGGTLVAHKVIGPVGVAAVLLAAAGAWWAFHDRDSRSRGKPAPSEATSTRVKPVASAVPELGARPPIEESPVPGSPSPAPSTGAYRGTLRDVDGNAVRAELEMLEALAVSPSGQVGSVDVRELARIRPDAQGAFAFDVLGGRGPARVRVHAPGFVPLQGGRDVLVFPGHPLEVVLARAAVLRVRVVNDATDEPVAGASVSAYGPLVAMLDHLRASSPTAQGETGADGEATLRTRSGPGVLVVRSDRFGPALAPDVDVAPQGLATVVRLRPGARVEGRFVDAAGRPKKGVHVEARGFPPYDADVTSDDDGRFVLAHAPTADDAPEPLGRYRLLLWCQVPGDPAGAARWFRVEPPGAGKTLSVVLTWHDARPLRGRVTRPDGTALSGAHVIVVQKGIRAHSGELDAPAAPVETDSEGRFAFDRVPPGPVTVRASAMLARFVSSSRDVDLPATGETPEVELVLGADDAMARRVEVAVSDSEGGPVAGVSVRPVSSAGLRQTDVQTSPAGTATVVVRPGDYLTVAGAGWAPVAVPVPVEGTRVGVRLGAKPLRGRVVRRDGRLLAGAPLHLATLARLPISTEPLWVGGGTAVSAEDGTFEFRGLGDGEYFVQSTRTAWRIVGDSVPVRGGDADVRIELGTEEEWRDLYVEAELLDGDTGKPPLTEGSLEVALVPPDAPFERIRRAPYADRAWLERVAGTEHVYRTPGPVRPGAYDLVVSGRFFGFRETRARNVRVALGHPLRRATITLDRGERIRGRVTEPDGSPAVGASVFAEGQWSAVRDDGTYEMTGLDEGPVDVRVTGPFAETPTVPVAVRRGEVATADFGVVRGGAIALLPDEGAFPAQRLVAVARPVAGGRPATLDLDAKALASWPPPSLVLRCLPPGRYSVEVDWDGRTLPVQEVDVVVAEVTKVGLTP